MIGWTCPQCGRANAPHIDSCNHEQPAQVFPLPIEVRPLPVQPSRPTGMCTTCAEAIRDGRAVTCMCYRPGRGCTLGSGL